MDERKIWKNWTYLKNELHVEDLLDPMVESGVFTSVQKRDILHVMPNTRQMKAEKFLNVLIQAGDRGFDTFIDIIKRNNDNRYSAILGKLEVEREADVLTVNHGAAVNNGAAASGNESRPSSGRPQSGMSAASGSTDISSRSLPSRDGETGERNIRLGSARRAWRSDSQVSQAQQPQGIVRAPSTGETTHVSQIRPPYNAPERTYSSFDGSDGLGGDKKISVDMQRLEQELVRIAPTIADLFQKISETTSNLPASEEEIQFVKEENERLRKTNRALIDKLNSFQQRIIQLQIENKKLRETGEGVTETKADLHKKEHELKDLEKRLEEQKKALEQKEMELNLQLMKIRDIEDNIAKQRVQINKLEILQEEGEQDKCRQEEEMEILRQERFKQKEKIDKLEIKQRMGDERLHRLEERLKSLEQASLPGNKQIRRRDPKMKSNKRLLGLVYNNDIT